MGDYFYPEYELIIGDYVITEGIKLEVQLDTVISFDWIRIMWTEKLLNAITANIKDEISLSVGYDGGLTQIFTGYVTNVDDLQLVGKNEMLKLHETNIINSFKHCTPEDVLTFTLDEAGINEYEIGGSVQEIKKLYNVSNMTAMILLKDIDKFFQLAKSTIVFNNKKFEWNVKPPQSVNYFFSYAENIITLENINKHRWELETVLVAEIKLLHEINIEHPKISGSFVVDRIRYHIDENGFVRLKMQFSEE